MPDPDFWSKVRAQRDAQQPPSPRDRILWVLVRKDQRAEAVVRLVDGVGHELRFLHNGELKRSQVYRDDQEWQGASLAMKAELEAKGWIDPTRLEWGN
jgi:hypothetical protein